MQRGKSSSVREFLVHNTFAKTYAFRRGEWLLVDAPHGSHNKVPDWLVQAEDYESNDLPFALFNLRTDQGQHHNVAAELQAQLRKLREQGHSRPRLAGR